MTVTLLTRMEAVRCRAAPVFQAGDKVRVRLPVPLIEHYARRAYARRRRHPEFFLLPPLRAQNKSQPEHTATSRRTHPDGRSCYLMSANLLLQTHITQVLLDP